MRDQGYAAVELALAIAVLLLPVIVVVSAFGPWSERRVLAEAAAAEAARATVLQLDHRAGADVVMSAISGRGLDAGMARLGWCGARPTAVLLAQPGCPLVRGGSVEARVDIWAPVVRTPWGEVGGVWVTGVHSEPLDLYRSFG